MAATSPIVCNNGMISILAQEPALEAEQNAGLPFSAPPTSVTPQSLFGPWLRCLVSVFGQELSADLAKRS